MVEYDRGGFQLIKIRGITMNTELKVVTFNLRITVDDGINIWQNRVTHIINKIKNEAPDMIGFQELTNISLNDLN